MSDRPTIVIATTDTDRAHLLGRMQSIKGYERSIAAYLALVETPSGVAGLEATFDEHVLIVVPRDTPLQESVARLCFHAWDVGVTTVLVRRIGEGAPAAWCEHPANVVVDVAEADWVPTLSLLGAVFLQRRAETLPLPPPVGREQWARLAVLRGDPRRSAFSSELAARGFEHVLHVSSRFLASATRSGGSGVESIALGFEPLKERPATSAVHPVAHHALAHDPRCYASSIEPADAPRDQADAIARLHAAHGNWRLTRTLADECCNEDREHASELLSELIDRIADPRFSLYADLCALAEQHRPEPILQPTWATRARVRTGGEEPTVDGVPLATVWARADGERVARLTALRDQPVLEPQVRGDVMFGRWVRVRWPGGE